MYKEKYIKYKKKYKLLKKNIMKLIEQNIKPLAFLGICSSIGFFCGSPLGGLMVGILIISAVTVFS